VPGVTSIERRHSLFYPALLSLGVGVLASCAGKPPALPPQTVAVQPQPPLPLPPAPRRRVFPVPARKPTPPLANDGSGAGTVDEAIAMANPEPGLHAPQAVAPSPQANELVGLDQPAARHLFGTATEQSEAPPATVWRYRNATCELDLFFYLDLRSGKMRALHYTFKGGTGDPAGHQDCLRSLVVARGS
jgi:hypothetical protein